ncbi:MAG: hypothetical protein MJ236_03775 [Clostridia bacterium]|nr:hypothetical protein [Clostridia bacterium]
MSKKIYSKTLSHAYLIVGAKGSGKKTLAEAIACEMANAYGSDAEVGSIKNRMCPDVVWARKEENKKTFGVDAVRSAISTVSLSPNSLDFKLYIFEDSDLLTIQAQNALLKVIEEPPANTFFLLLCNNVASIITTVRSRVQTIYMDVMPDKDILDYLRQNDINIKDETKKGFVLRLCNGAAGHAKELAESDEKTGEYASYLKVCDIVKAQGNKKLSSKYFEFLNMFTSFGQSREALTTALDYLIVAYRDIFAVKSNENAKTRFFSYDDALNLSSLFADEAIELSIAAVSRIRNALVYNTNLNTSTVLLAQLLWKSF